MHIEFLKRNAENKIKDALILFRNGSYSNAYYLGGYSVEIALKARIAMQISANTIPERKFIIDLYTHELPKLIGLAGLKPELAAEQDRNPVFSANWGLVGEWSPDHRYQTTDNYNCEIFLNAIANETGGVLPWIQKHW